MLGGDAPILYCYENQTGQRSLTDTQTAVLQQYFEHFMAPTFVAFIESAPRNPNLQSLRAFLISKSVSMPIDIFQNFLSKFYPEVHDDNQDYVQNCYFRKYLIDFNSLCLGNKDINNPIYAMTFDPRYSPTKSNSPTKKILVSKFFEAKVAKLVSEFNQEDEFVMLADSWISVMLNQQTETLNQASKEKKVRRQLFK